jgi:hypothetical protein
LGGRGGQFGSSALFARGEKINLWTLCE